MNEQVGIWGWDGVAPWVKVLVDATGHLQVDVIAAPAFVTHCYGWDTANWIPLTFQGVAIPNLRTVLFDGVNLIVSVATAADIADANRGLFTQAGVRGWDGAFWKSVNVEDDAGDALVNARASLSVVSKLYGYNEATWDRLRVMTPADAFVTPTYALQVSSFLMGYDGVDWNMVRVDAAGHLQVDVLSSVLPTGAPNYGQANIRNQLLSLSYTVLNTRLPSALDTDSLKVREQGAPRVHLYGYDGSFWQNLLVETAGDPNLRVRLYAGANAIDDDTIDTTFARTQRGLHTLAALYADDGTTLSRLRVTSAVRPYLMTQLYAEGWGSNIFRTFADGSSNTANAFVVASHLIGFNGAGWDRLRTYGTGVLTVAKGAIGPTRIRMTATGRVGVAGAKKLFWVACSPDGPSAEWEIADSDAGGGTVVYDHFDTDKHSDHLDFDPPLEFSTGIWVEKFDHMKSIVFCYI